MMILLFIVLLILLVLIGILVYAATKPDQYTIKRSILIQARAEQIYPLINNLHTLNRCNPLLGKDPSLRGTYNEIAAGEGASYSYEGNKRTGSGYVSITRSKPSRQVDMSLLMLKPFPGTNEISFYLQPDAAATEVTCHMHGKSPYIMKVRSVFFNMDAVVGKAFEQGLVNLKQQVEQQPG